MVLLAWIVALGQAVFAQGTPAALLTRSAETNLSAGPSGMESPGKTLDARLAEARASLAAFGDAALTNAPAGIPPQDVWTRRAGLHRLVRLYEQQLSSATVLDKAKARRAEIAREAPAWRRFAEPPPYSILLTDHLREEIQTERQKVRTREAAATMLNQLIEENRDSLEQAEEKSRQLQEQLETASDLALAARLSWQRELERLRSQVAVASVAGLDLERLIGQEELAESRIRLGLLQRQLVFADAGASFTQADLDKVTRQIERQRELLEPELAKAQTQQVAARRALETAREESRGAPDRTEVTPAPPQVSELIVVREAQMETADTAAYVLRVLLEGASLERTMWEFRFAAYDSRSVETLNESERRLGFFTRRLALWREYARQQLDVSSSQFQLQEARLNALGPAPNLLSLTHQHVEALRERELMLRRLVRGVERLERLTERWAEGLRAAEGKLPFTSRVRNVFSDARSFLQRLWSFEVFTAEDTITVDGQKITGKRSVTIGKIIMAVLILVVGIWIIGLVTRIAEPIIVRRLKIEANQAGLVRRWLRVALIACLVLFSLTSVKIPLTVFAFAGGALAIGLGFGTQTLLKNFVSGLILLFERPFRVGDVLDVGGQKGTVTSIGLRASVLQLWDGTETLIPNSALLENNVTNWTYSNRSVRFSVSVGVAYGTDPRRVIQLLNEVAGRHGLVEKEPKPQVLFTEFGDSTLLFELRFWVDVVRANAAQVSSDLRLMIAGAFAEHGIVIAFPQRDLHLDAARPIQVQVVAAADGGRGAVSPSGKAEAGDKSGETL